MKKSKKKVCSTRNDSRKKEVKKVMTRSTRHGSMKKVNNCSGSGNSRHGNRRGSTKKDEGTTCKFCKRNFLPPDTLSDHLPYCYRKLVFERKKEEVGMGKDEDEGEEEFLDEDDGKVSWLAGGHAEYLAWLYAEKAVKYLNSLLGGTKYKLVRPGPFAAAGVGRGPIVHFNFKAKAKDKNCPELKIETFFGQLRIPNSNMVVDLCVSLGPSHNLPPWDSANFHNCTYCKYAVHHPHPSAKGCAKLIRGIDSEDVDWLYGPRRDIDIYGPPTDTDSSAEFSSDSEDSSDS